MTFTQIIQLVSLAAIWGSSFMFMRIAAPEFGPLSLIAARALLGFITLLPIFIYVKKFDVFKQNWWPIFVVGMTNTAIPFSLLFLHTQPLRLAPALPQF